MYCPQCGQQQLSAETRFCSRCGFPMGGVTHLLTTNGLLPTIGAAPKSLEPSQRKQGVRQGVSLLMVGAVLVPVLGVLESYVNLRFLEILPPLAAVICFIGGIVRVLYALIFESGFPAPPRQFPAQYSPPVRQGQVSSAPPAYVLPPSQGEPVQGWSRRVNTAELAMPPSVTENTTKLLDEEERRSR
jgi:hypothetical protein